MAWGIREWAISGGYDWTVHLDAEAESRGEVLATIELMLANGRPDIDVFFGPGVMFAAKEESIPETLLVKEPEPYQHELSSFCGHRIEAGPLPALLKSLEGQLESNGKGSFLADWKDLQADADERALNNIAPVGNLTRPSALSR